MSGCRCWSTGNRAAANASVRIAGRFAVVGPGDNWWDVVHVDDVAGAFVTALEQAPPGALYHVADDDPITLYDFVALTAEALGTTFTVRLPRRSRARLAATPNPEPAL